jgi:hypothetical protein
MQLFVSSFLSNLCPFKTCWHFTQTTWVLSRAFVEMTCIGFLGLQHFVWLHFTNPVYPYYCCQLPMGSIKVAFLRSSETFPRNGFEQWEFLSPPPSLAGRFRTNSLDSEVEVNLRPTVSRSIGHICFTVQQFICNIYKASFSPVSAQQIMLY